MYDLLDGFHTHSNSRPQPRPHHVETNRGPFAHSNLSLPTFHSSNAVETATRERGTPEAIRHVHQKWRIPSLRCRHGVRYFPNLRSSVLNQITSFKFEVDDCHKLGSLGGARVDWKLLLISRNRSRSLRMSLRPSPG